MQRTLACAVECCGIGIHSGQMVRMKLLPANVDTGITFIRSDLNHTYNTVVAHFTNVVDTAMCTKLANSYGVGISTVEHLMAAFWGSGISNVEVVLDGAEVPIMDGSSQEFLELIKKGGVKEQQNNRNQLVIEEVIKVGDKNGFIMIEPSDSFSIHFEIDFRNQFIARQVYDFEEHSDFHEEISKARTFGFINDFEKLKKLGFAKGASLENAVAVGEAGVLNEDGLRYEDEFVRHKVLDCIGDLYLASADIKGKVTAFKSGHYLNNLLLKKIFSVSDTMHMDDVI